MRKQVLRHSTPVLVTLEMPLVIDDYRGVALHDTIRCAVERPCITLKDGTTEDNVIPILCHEELHHILIWLGEEVAYYQLDNIMSSFEDTRKLLGIRGFRGD